MTALEPADFPRDRWGRPLVLINGELVPYQRPSQLGGCIEDRYNLELWGKRVAVQGLASDHAVYATAVALEIVDTKENKQEWNKVVEAALAARRSSAKAELGTALHKMTERIDRGEAIDLPPVFAADIKAYHDALAAAGLSVVPGMIEFRCVNDKVQAAGTGDRLLRHDGSGTIYVADIKTGDSSDFVHGFAVQFATYAYAELYDPATGERTPMPAELDRTRGIIIHLPAGQAHCTLKWLDLVKGWEAAKVAHWVRQTWQKDKKLAEQIVSISAPEPVAGPFGVPTDEIVTVPEPTSWLRAEQLRARIAKLTEAQRADLKAQWPAGISLKREVTAEESATVSALVARFEVAPEQVRTAPDEGRAADPHAVEALELRFVNLTPDQQKWVKNLAVEAHHAGAGLRLKDHASLRRFEIMRALVFLARHGLTERLIPIIEAVHECPYDGADNGGAGLACYGVHDAARFAQLVDALAIGDADEPPRLMPVA